MNDPRIGRPLRSLGRAIGNASPFGVGCSRAFPPLPAAAEAGAPSLVTSL